MVGENDLQFTTNKSARVGRSGSVAIGAFPKTDYTNTTEDDYPNVLTGFARSSYKTNGYKIGLGWEILLQGSVELLSVVL